MSGAKKTYVTLLAEEVRKLQNQAKRSDTIAAENRILEMQKRQREKREQDLQSKLARNEERYEKHVQNLNVDMQRIEREARADLNRQKQEYQQKLSEISKNQQNYTDNSIEQLDLKIQQDFKVQRDEYHKLIHNQKKQFDDALQNQGKTLQHHIDQIQLSIKNRLHQEDDM